MNEYKDLAKNLDLIYKVKYHGSRLTPVQISHIQKESDLVYFFTIENTHGIDTDCYEVFRQGIPLACHLSVVASDENNIKLKAEL